MEILLSICALSNRQVMRIIKIINLGMLFGYNTFVLRTSQQRNVWSSVRRISFQILGVKGLINNILIFTSRGNLILIKQVFNFFFPG